MTATTHALPAESGGAEMTRFNALRHGILSRYTVLPWEDVGEYRALVEALAAEHVPRGPTEEHLVEELAGVLWRMRRLRLAEAAAYRRGLDDTLEPYRETVKAALVHVDHTPGSERVVDAVRSTEADAAEHLADLDEDETAARRALECLSASGKDAYRAALAALRPDTRAWWDEEKPAAAGVAGLRRFLGEQVLPAVAARRQDIANRPLIREQAHGEALNVDKLERLARYEVHLDRKLERTLAMLLRLNELRRPTQPG